jgi:hypothetical protein
VPNHGFAIANIKVICIGEYPATPEIPENSRKWRLQKELQVPQEFPNNSKTGRTGIPVKMAQDAREREGRDPLSGVESDKALD